MRKACSELISTIQGFQINEALVVHASQHPLYKAGLNRAQFFVQCKQMKQAEDGTMVERKGYQGITIHTARSGTLGPRLVLCRTPLGSSARPPRLA